MYMKNVIEYEPCYLFCSLFFSFVYLKGWMYDHTGSYDIGFAFLGVVQATGALVFAADHLRQKCNRMSIITKIKKWFDGTLAVDLSFKPFCKLQEH